VPSGPGIRLDDGVYPGFTVPTDYDPLLGKLIAWGADRAEAIVRLRRALDEYYVTGIKTNTNLFRRILADPEFAAANFHTRWLDERLKSFIAQPAEFAPGSEDPVEDIAILAAVLWHMGQDSAANLSKPAPQVQSRWKREGRREQHDRAAKAMAAR
jgi:acetyl-CoA carboxylase biotin carboxylase subunit